MKTLETMTKQKPMTGTQLQALIDSVELSQVAAAKAIDIGPRTMRRYVAGEDAIPRKVEYALKWLVSQMQEDA